MPATLWAAQALLPQGWARQVLVELADDGRIAAIHTDAPSQGQQVDVLLPAPSNLHSHAFQRALAGLTETRLTSRGSSFWTWRTRMFALVERLQPEHVRAISAWAQVLMLESGFAAVGEFQYLHRDRGGVAYQDPAELSAQVVAAAEQTGMGLTLLPVLYEVGGCDGRPLEGGQQRFGNSLDEYLALVESARGHLARLPADAQLGLAPHSLRAVTRSSLKQLSELGEGPLHLHLAEQMAEVEEVQTSLGSRPVQWLLDHHQVDPRWCLIHCTHMEPAETRALAATGAVVGLCPITEASLGDGIFPAAEYQRAGGQWGIGTDSNVRISLTEELRMLEYSQRLSRQRRAILCQPPRSTGRTMWDGMLAGGARALGRQTGGIAVGAWADLVALRDDHPETEGRTGDAWLDTYLFVVGDRLVTDVWSAGRHVVHEGRHRDRDAIEAAYRQARQTLEGCL